MLEAIMQTCVSVVMRTTKITTSITKTRLFKYIETFTSINLKIFRYKNSDIFHMSAQNIDCGYSLEPSRRGGSNEYPQSMFLSRNKKIIYTPVDPSFTIWKWGLRGQYYIGMFSWWSANLLTRRWIYTKRTNRTHALRNLKTFFDQISFSRSLRPHQWPSYK